MVRACDFCRRRKIKCDTIKPICSPCRRNDRSCVYHNGPKKARPSAALIASLRNERAAMENALVRLKTAEHVERHALLESLTVTDGHISSLPDKSPTLTSETSHPSRLDPSLRQDPSFPGEQHTQQRNTENFECVQAVTAPGVSDVAVVDAAAIADLDGNGEGGGDEPDDDDGHSERSSSEDEQDAGETLVQLAANNKSIQDSDTIFSSTSVGGVDSPARRTTALNFPSPRQPEAAVEAIRYQLIANAALERQREHRLRSMTTIRGISAELALHLLDLHWSRQHHTFLLTYRPAFMRELVEGGPYCSDLLLYAVFACSSKFSQRLEVRDDPSDPETAGHRFLTRCDEILLREGALSHSQIPTIIALIMLGSTFIARGITSKGWLYTGYAVRMVYDLGLHVDPQEVNMRNAEEVEIRRRVFWGAFVCEKLQSLYLGRPPTIRLGDARVSQEFLDTFEELEQWEPYEDPIIPDAASRMMMLPGAPLAYSVSVFQQLCLLSKIMTRIINKIYFTGATALKTFNEIHPLDDALQAFYLNLPQHLAYEPWTKAPMQSPIPVAPNRIILLTTYHSLVILLHRPFIATPTGDSYQHLSTAATNEEGNEHQPVRMSAYSWKRCTAAARNITSLTLSYRSIYPLRKSSYLLSYAVYVACTIHVLNVASLATGGDTTAREESSLLLAASLGCLDELAVPNSGAANTARIIRKLMAAKGVQELPTPVEFQTSASNELFDHVWRFSNESPTWDNLAQMQPFQYGCPPGQDLLFGFMDESMAFGLHDGSF